MNDGSISRRELLKGGRDAGSLLALSALLPGADVLASAGASTTELRTGADVYRSIGVRPLINARGTFTIISGSLLLPEVRAAMDAAARQFVHLDELTDAIGARLATLTGAEWGLVTSGCAAALTHATAACVAGGNPDLHIRIPHLDGFAKDEVIIPKHSRNVYDAALRVVGVRVIEVSTLAELDAALGPRTAMVYVLAGPNADNSELSVKAMAPSTQAMGVPILVDAAAEILTIPNVHLQNGATLVAYSGGKCIRGPQAAGLLLGRKDLVRAAWVHSAPHHGFARSMKVGKEEAIGMLMAVEMWIKRDHDAEWKRWASSLDHIAARVSAIDGVTTSVVQPAGLSNRTPSLRIWWEPERMGLTGEGVARTLLETEPRVALFPARDAANPARTGVSVTPYMLSPGEERIVADRLHAVLSAAPRSAAPSSARSAAVDLTGSWDVRIQYAASSSNHVLHLRQRGSQLDGTHQGNFVSRDLSGSIDGDAVRIRSFYGEQHGDALTFTFSGTVSGDSLAGSLDMGEYLGATWTAKRHA
jgi:L-seryl-tRNA(Ser) seleniumtransferase